MLMSKSFVVIPNSKQHKLIKKNVFFSSGKVSKHKQRRIKNTLKKLRFQPLDAEKTSFLKAVKECLIS